MRNQDDLPDLPDGVIDADPAGGWDENDDVESRERSDAERVEGDQPGQGADPDLSLPDEEVR